MWSPRDRLGYDWGFAGYQTGSSPPVLPVKVNLKTQYGARGDGRTDDTQALLNAVNDITGGVIYIPAGDGTGVMGWRHCTAWGYINQSLSVCSQHVAADHSL